MRRRLPWLLSAFALLIALGASALVLPRLLQPQPSPAGTAGAVDWAAMLGRIADPGFERLSGPWQLALPADHGAHPDTRTETWTISAHLRTELGDPVGLQFALFRLALVNPDAPDAEDWSGWAPHEIFGGHVALLRGTGGPAAGEVRFNRAVLGLAGHDAAGGKVWLDDWSLAFGTGPEENQLRLGASAGEARMELVLSPAKGAVASDRDGTAEPFRGFSITRMAADGYIEAEHGRRTVSGLAWLDHLWGDVPLPVGPIAWDRLQLQLDDGSELAVLRTRRRDGSGSPTLDGYLVDPGGAVERLEGASLAMEGTRTWRPGTASASYPLDWRLSLGELQLSISPRSDDQLHDFVAPFWSGIVTAEGHRDGRTVSGVGTLQLTGYGSQ